MRFMMLMIPGVYQGAEGRNLTADFAPSAAEVKEMMQYNEELAKAGVLVSLDGLHPLSQGARISFAGGSPVVTDGPFAEVKEVIGGYWLINVKSKEEAVRWARKCPAQSNDVIEIRQIFEMEEFPADVQKAADSPAVKAQITKNK